MKNNEVNLLLRSFDEELDGDERRRLDSLLDRSPEARVEHARLRRMRRMVGASRAEAFAPGFADRVLDRMAEPRTADGSPSEPRTTFGSAHSEPRTASSDRAPGRSAAPSQGTQHTSARRDRSPARNRTRIFGWMGDAAPVPWRLAAGLTAVLVVLALVLWLGPRTVDVPPGTLRTLELSDGSTVELNGGSTLTYRHFFGRSDRRVELTGEAFFAVASDERPFHVETFNASVRVLGTRFNVRAWPDDDRTDVALQEGRVAVEPRSPQSRTLAMQSLSGPVVLEPGESTTVSADSAATPRTVPIDRLLVWRTGGLFIADQPLSSAFREIERRFGVRVTTPDPDLLDREVSFLDPSPESAADVLATICHALDLRYRRTAGGFEVLTP